MGKIMVFFGFFFVIRRRHATRPAAHTGGVERMVVGFGVGFWVWVGVGVGGWELGV